MQPPLGPACHRPEIVLNLRGALQESYKLLFLTAPAVGEMEESIRTLRETIASAKETIAEKEALIGKHNPRLFQTLQVRSPLAYPDQGDVTYIFKFLT